MEIKRSRATKPVHEFGILNPKPSKLNWRKHYGRKPIPPKFWSKEVHFSFAKSKLLPFRFSTSGLFQNLEIRSDFEINGLEFVFISEFLNQTLSLYLQDIDCYICNNNKITSHVFLGLENIYKFSLLGF